MLDGVVLLFGLLISIVTEECLVEPKILPLPEPSVILFAVYFVITAQNKVYTAVNTAMVLAYWEIGEQIYKTCGENDRAEYGKNLLKYLSERLTAEFGKGFDESNLRRMRQFYLTYPIRDTLCHELSWSHYRILMKIYGKP